MAYNLGAVGFGHWFERLYAGMARTDKIHLAKVIGVSPMESKAGRLKLVGINKDTYYRMEPDAKIPKEFFDGLDIVHISNPNKYHASHTLQALGEGKITITEKTWGVDKEEFDSVIRHIRDNGLEGRAYLHLHYLHKLLTIQLSNTLKRFEPEHGRIVGVSATFFEALREDDKRRGKWLFSMENGGLFMDWVHPFEIFYRGAGADAADLKDVELYAINADYGTSDPTGIEANVELGGEHFKGDVPGTVRIAKGAPSDKKSVRFYLESGAYLDLDYVNNDVEASTGMRGCWTLVKDGRELATECPKGPDTSDFLVGDILRLAEGERAGFGTEYMERIFGAQWQYRKIQEGKGLISSKEKVAGFIGRGAGLDL
ncbi:MAG: hypothetical protein M1321_02325 [Candidatus Marsarchaeota archaeon]|nr:hypothetical protein [Candidatus Marsarchaeota archaeon]